MRMGTAEATVLQTLHGLNKSAVAFAYDPTLFGVLVGIYSRSIRAKCHGPVPCKGSSLQPGTLRYGQRTADGYSENVVWRHWGCVTPSILSQLATVTLDSVRGFNQVADQNKIRTAVSLRRVDPADIPATAKRTTESRAVNSAPGIPVTAKRTTESRAITAPGRKRRREEYDVPNSQASSSVSGLSGPSAVQREQVHEEEDSDSVEPDEALDELYVTKKLNVVGVQYYNGLVGPGEEVRLIREPVHLSSLFSNHPNRNAIQVQNIGSVQVGHLPKAVVAKLAPLLDQGLVTVEGIMIQGNCIVLSGVLTSSSSTLKIYGSPNRRQELESKLIWATPGQNGFSARKSASHSRVGAYSASQLPTPSYPGNSSQQLSNPAQQEAVRKRQEEFQKAADLKKMLASLDSTSVDAEKRRNSLLDRLLSGDDILKLPVCANAPGIGNGLTVELMKHQSQALQWAMEREYPKLPEKVDDKPVQFWQLRKDNSKTYYYNLVTKTPQQSQPELGRGALCADAMGLGKTLTMLALILVTKTDVPKDFSNSTLIVAPLSVLSNWEKQIQDHCAQRSLSYYVYYGPKRDIKAADLQQFDVVITTYQVVAGEHDERDPDGPSKKKKKLQQSLFDVRWKRVVLDEAHMIRNLKTKMAKAVCALTAQRRWALAATPIINSPKDLGSLLSFLQICRPLDREDFFNRLLLRPLKNGDPSGAVLLRNLMSHICIRRTKEMQDADGNPLVPLPPVEMIIVPVALSDEARALYDKVEQLSRNRVAAYMKNNSTLAQSKILSLLTRMRQLVLHTGLVPASYAEELRMDVGDDSKAHAQTTVVTPDDKLRLQVKLRQAIEECEECPVCLSLLVDPRITSCAHIFCLPCPLMDATFGDDRESTSEGSSTKIDQLIQLLSLNPSRDKSLVFSQFTSFLDKIAERFEETGIAYVRFDGRMSAKQREECIAQVGSITSALHIYSEVPSFLFPLPTTNYACWQHLKGGVAVLADLADSDFEIAPGNDSDFIDDEDDAVAYAKKKSKAKGKGKQKSKAHSYTTRASNSTDGNARVMLISLKAGALGLNLTAANNVYLWWQEGIESQAIDRVNRIGQTKPVHVYQLIAENTVESKALLKAFSGMKRTETQRQQKEARLQDLVELFGLKQQESQTTA
ncbi:SNF2 family N-terminal domain-containing protein [Mycena pura]|uniref:SNF2 family N-terminal domain-containing protein n=1 Tax=Mycena pura TaxID=153505 RepID=A0AAD6YJ45_9AGAR|nr:SNF2 family N-terminal domain-containing protein [Mycena pura]